MKRFYFSAMFLALMCAGFVCAVPTDGKKFRQKVGSGLGIVGTAILGVTHWLDGKNVDPGPKSKWFIKNISKFGVKIHSYGLGLKTDIRFDFLDTRNKYELAGIAAATCITLYYLPTIYKVCIHDPLYNLYCRLRGSNDEA